MAELKTCPFCGGEASIKESRETMGFGDSDTLYYVRCNGCGCRTKGISRLDALCEDERVIKAIEAWNRRAEDA